MSNTAKKLLLEIREIKKCSNCICLKEILKLTSSISSLSEDHKNNFLMWIEEINEKEIHDCLGCNPCLPFEAYNIYHAPKWQYK